MTQAQMADVLGLRQASVNKYEHGIATPTVENLRKYADYFGVSMDYIFARTDNMQRELYISYSEFLANDADIQKFSEMCFNPESPFNEKLRQMIIQILEETQNELNKN